MPISYNQDVQLRLSTRVDGAEGVTELDKTVEDLQKDLQATATASRSAAEAQALAASRLKDAKGKYDDVSVALRGAQNEYRYLRQRARESGAAQSLFADQARAARDRVQVLRDELVLTRTNLRVLGTESKNAAAEVRGLAAEQRRLGEALKSANAEAQKQGSATDMLGGGLKRLAGVAAGLELGREFIESNLAIESLQRTMVQLTGSTEAAAKEIDWLKQTSTRLGVQVNDSARAYASLSAATKGTRLEGEQTHAIFEAVAGAMSKLGRSSADTEGALQAIGQMVGKGTVQMEELRGQLAERLPGALDATAKAMGITTSELVTMVSSGQVLAADLIPKLTEGLNTLYGTGKVEGSLASWNRLKNSIAETFQFIGQSGVMEGAAKVMDVVGGAVRGLTGAFELLGKATGIALAAIVTFDPKHPIDSMRRWKDALVDAGNEIQGKLDKASGAIGEAESAHEKAATAAERAGAAAGSAAGGWLAAQAAYAKASKAAEQATSIAVKSAEARQAEAKLTLDMVNAFGTEAEKRTAGVAAANAEAVALQAVADARRTEADLAGKQAQALITAVGGEQNLNAEQAKSVQAALASAAAKEAEADKAQAAAAAARLHAAAIQTSSAAVADNSTRVDELRAEMERTQGVYELYQDLQKSGLATDQQVDQSKLAAAQSSALYRDALNDQAAARERDVAAAQRSQQANTAQLASDQAIVRVQLELARIRGDSRGVLEAQNKLRQIEIKMLEATAAGARLEAKAIVASAEAKKAELAASGLLTPARQAEIDAMIQSAKLKDIEAQKSDTLARLQRELSDEMERVGTSGRGAGDSIADSYDRAADASDRLNDSILSRPGERRPAGGGGGSGGGGGGGSAPSDDLSVDQMQNMGMTQREIEDYQLNRKPEQQKPGHVNRMVSTESVDAEQVARNAGLRGDAVKRFAEIYPDILKDKMADFFASGSLSIGTPNTYRDGFATAQNSAIREASDKSRGRPAQAVEVKMIKIQIGKEEIPVTVADDQSAQNLLRTFEQLNKTSSRRN